MEITESLITVWIVNGLLQTDYLTGDLQLTSCGTQAFPSHTGVSPAMCQQSSLWLQWEERNSMSWKLSDWSLFCSVQVTIAVYPVTTKFSSFKMTIFPYSKFCESGFCKVLAGHISLGVFSWNCGQMLVMAIVIWRLNRTRCPRWDSQGWWLKQTVVWSSARLLTKMFI